jgi:nucleoside-diphosphate-sugar epimerase
MRVLICGGVGYIGSAVLEYLRSREYAVDTVDLEWFGNAVNARNSVRDYGSLTRSELEHYDVVILTAAHSSVGMCRRDPYGAFRNNVANFVNLLSRLRRQRLIYASSSCVYQGSGSALAREEQTEFRPCDHLTLTKTAIDHYAMLSDVEFYGLRFGSVNGSSPNFRGDLMVNGMVTAAMREGVVRVANGEMHRPILAMQDLVRAIEAILMAPSAPGIYNVASLNARIDAVGETVSRLVHYETGPTYDFSMSTERFQTTFRWGPRETLSTIVGSIVRDRAYERTGGREAPPGGGYDG